MLVQIDSREKDRVKSASEYYKQQGYRSTPSKDAKTFTSLFGPIIKTARYSNDVRRVRGCAWDKLSDDNVTFYEGGWDSALHKRIKSMFNGKIRGMIIACDPDSHDIIYAVRGFRSTDSEGKLNKPTTYQFDTYKNYSGEQKKRLKQVTTNAYKYQTRDLNANELIETLNDFEIYFIEIPDSMVQDYNTLVTDRKESQKGVVNYDKESLDALAKQQRAHYKVLAKELRAKRLAENPEFLFNEITKTNEKVIEIYRKVSKDYELADKFYSIGDLMSYTANVFDDYFRYLRNMKSANDSQKHAEEEGKENPERYGKYYKEQAADYLESCKQRLDRIKKEIDEIEQSLAA